MAASAPTSSPRSRNLIIYGILTTLLVGLAFMAKAAAVIVAQRLLYPLPLVGGLVRSLEVLDLLNILIFAIVGMGLGLLTRFLPPDSRYHISYGLLVVLMPLLFLSGSLLHYQLWVNGVSTANDLTYATAKTLTNEWLQSTLGDTGFWGYYRFTAQYTVLPLEPDQVRQATLGADRVGSLVGGLVGWDQARVIGWLSFNTWILRLFYFAIACFSGITHFQDGIIQMHLTQDRQQQKRQQQQDKRQFSSGKGLPSSPSQGQDKTLDRQRREYDRQQRLEQAQADAERDRQERNRQAHDRHSQAQLEQERREAQQRQEEKRQQEKRQQEKRQKD
ncbi:hypothetical protein [Prochlorothrix hollandica]|uniref:Uncharacterized protein n=1 Tax=Prochlorothrix hollandica PCC 9006 = CALU 1027 TaxID=317619 RepID=A0A0M2PP31_PROHO|nr:hypothetical protein [Prochlorothrix hollandica]KKI98034.1 hypothetical protein PROH_20010 [Prochlorothrix hollandica PCC 9006 = CALU 1027]